MGEIGVTAATKALHFHQFKRKHFETLIKRAFFKNHGYKPTRGQIYRLATQYEYYHDVLGFDDYRDCFNLSPHDHILGYSKYEPALGHSREKHFDVNSKKYRKRGYQTIKVNTYHHTERTEDTMSTDNGNLNFPINKQDRSSSKTITDLKPLIKELTYEFGHVGLLDVPGRSIHTVVPMGSMRTVTQDFINVYGEYEYWNLKEYVYNTMVNMGIPYMNKVNKGVHPDAKFDPEKMKSPYERMPTMDAVREECLRGIWSELPDIVRRIQNAPGELIDCMIDFDDFKAALKIALSTERPLIYYNNPWLYETIKNVYEEFKDIHSPIVPYGRFKIRPGHEDEDNRFIEDFAATLPIGWLPTFRRFVKELNLKLRDPTLDRRLKIVFTDELPELQEAIDTGLEPEYIDSKMVDFCDLRGKNKTRSNWVSYSPPD